MTGYNAAHDDEIFDYSGDVPAATGFGVFTSPPDEFATDPIGGEDYDVALREAGGGIAPVVFDGVPKRCPRCGHNMMAKRTGDVWRCFKCGKPVIDAPIALLPGAGSVALCDHTFELQSMRRAFNDLRAFNAELRHRVRWGRWLIIGYTALVVFLLARLFGV